MQKSSGVIPANAGIQSFQAFLVPGFRRGDGICEFCKSLEGQNKMKLCSFREYVHEVLKTAVYEAGEDLSCVVAQARALPGCITQGETFEEARALLIDAVETWVLSTLRDGGPLPVVGGCALAVAHPEVREVACA